MIESFNGRLRDECLNVHAFESIENAKQTLEAWQREITTSIDLTNRLAI
ncbi:integrase core domain-containing protein [Luteibacter jiangsuensis]